MKRLKSLESYRLDSFVSDLEAEVVLQERTKLRVVLKKAGFSLFDLSLHLAERATSTLIVFNSSSLRLCSSQTSARIVVSN